MTPFPPRRLKAAVLTATLLIGPASSGALAQTPQPQTTPATAPAATAQTASLSLADALALLPASPGWRSADLALEAARGGLNTARARAGLTLGLGGDYSLSQNPLGEAWRGSSSASVNASSALLPWSPAFEGVRTAQRALERAELTRRSSREDLVLTVERQYFAARAAAADLQLASAQQDLAGRQLEITRRQREAGQVTQEQLLERQQAAQDAQAAFENARLNAELTLSQLFSTLGVAARPVTLTSTASEPSAPAPLGDGLARGLATRAEIRQAQSSLRDAQAALDAARRDRALPNLNVTARYGQLGPTGQGSGTVLSAGLNVKSGIGTLGLSTPLSGASGENGVALGVSGSFNLLDPVADQGVASNQTAVQSAALALENARSSVELDVRQKYTQLQGALASLTGLRTAVQRAETAVASAQARAGAGLATELDIASASQALGQARQALVKGQQNAALAALDLTRATGDLDPALLTTPTGGSR